RTARLKQYALSEQEWTLLRQLWPLLNHFLQVTKQMSTSTTPQIFKVIPIMNVLTATLNKYASNKMLFPAVRSAATRGHEINKYYSLMDDSIVYQIAMVLHPRYKTIYFQRQKWPDSWVDTAV
ncbi:hypothetical protein K439DRAFT_1298393, partial [Ramaria rubella]